MRGLVPVAVVVVAAAVGYDDAAAVKCFDIAAYGWDYSYSHMYDHGVPVVRESDHNLPFLALSLR
jgi:hypothetical protein